MKRILLLLALLIWPLGVIAQDSGATDAQTQRDRSYLTGLIEDNLSGAGRTVRLDGFQGALSSRATFTSLTISDDQGAWITIKDGAIQWNRTALLTGKIEIDELSAAEIDLPRLPSAGSTGPSAPAPEAKPFALPELPVAVNIGKIDAKKVVLGQPILGQKADLKVTGSMSLAGGAGKAKLQIARIDGQKGNFSLNASYDNKSRDLGLDLLVDEGQGGIISKLIGLPGEPAITLAVSGSGPIDKFTADVVLSTDGQQRVSGQVAINGQPAKDAPAGTTPDTRFSAAFSGDVSPLLPAAYRDFFGSDATFMLQGARTPSGQTKISALDVKARALSLQGSAHVGAAGLPTKFDLTGQFGLADDQEVLLPISGTKTWVKSGQIKLSYDASAGDGWTLAADLNALRREDGTQLERAQIAGSGRIRQGAVPSIGGTVTLSANGLDLADPGLKDAVGSDVTGKAMFSWQKDKPLRISQLSVSGQGYKADANLQIKDLQKGAVIAGTAKLADQDLSRISGLAQRKLGGALSGTVSGSYTVLTGAFDADLDITGQDLSLDQPQADAALKGRSEIKLKASRDTNGLTIHAFNAQTRAVTAVAKGTLSSNAGKIDADLRAKDLSVMGPGYSGSLSATAAIQMTKGDYSGTVDATSDKVALGIPQLDRVLQGKSTLHFSGGYGKDGTITVDGFDAKTADVSASAKGQIGPASGSLDADLRVNDLSVLGAGYRGTLDASGKLTRTAARAFAAQLKATGGNLAIGQAEIDRVLAGQTTLDLDGEYDNGRIRLHKLDLKNPQLTVSADGAGDATSRKVNLDARLSNAALLAPGFPGPVTVSGTVSDDGTGYQLALNGTGPGGTEAKVSGRVASDFSDSDLSITGRAQTALANAFIQPRSVQGPLNFDLRMQGKPGLAALSGTVSATGARVVAPNLGMALDGVTARVNLSGGRAQLDVSGQLGSGGKVSVSGPITLSAPFNGNLTIRLANARFRDPQLYDTRATGTITMDGALTGGAKIAGKINLSSTELRVPSAGVGGTSAVPDGLKNVGESAAVRTTLERAGLLNTATAAQQKATATRAFPLDLTIASPRGIFVRGRGLDAELGGSLRITGTTANVVPIGQFNLVRGRLDILGQRFTLDKGQIALQGAFVPWIDFAAVTTQGDYTITIGITGRATEPNVSFSSAPDLPQDEVLSRLIFGRGVSTLSPLQAAQLASAVATLAGKGGDGIIGTLRKSTGLDDLDVSTDAQGNTQLKAGKYLSDNLYSDVVVNGDGTTTINLNLDINKSVTARGSVGSDGSSGVGIYYERNY